MFFKKGKPKGYGKKGGKRSRPGFRPMSEGKVLQHGKMTSKTQLSGERKM
jgi:hypothetical protein